MVIDYMITGKCNLHCPFCYGPDPKMKGELSKEAKKMLLQFLAEQGIRDIVIAGGEPSISPHIGAVLDWCTQMSFRVALQTNAFKPHLLQPHLHKLAWLCVPIDGTDQKANHELRTAENHLEQVLDVVNMAQQYRTNGLRLKIGTVVTPINITQVLEIAAVVQALKPNVWKWYQTRPRGQGYINFRSLYASTEDIRQAEIIVRNQFPYLPITVSLIDDTVGAYIIINPDSEILIPQVEGYTSCGRLINVNERMEINFIHWENALAELNRRRHTLNVQNSFPGTSLDSFGS